MAAALQPFRSQLPGVKNLSLVTSAYARVKTHFVQECSALFMVIVTQ
jgi:hypothetical protein